MLAHQQILGYVSQFDRLMQRQSWLQGSPHSRGLFSTKPTSNAISSFTGYLNTLINFINNKYVPDAQPLSNIYSDYHQIGKGPGNFIAFGVFDSDGTANPKRLLKRGVVYNSNPTSVMTLSTANITEMVTKLLV